MENKNNQIDEQCEREGLAVMRARMWSSRNYTGKRIGSKIHKFAGNIPIQIKKEKTPKNMIDNVEFH